MSKSFKKTGVVLQSQISENVPDKTAELSAQGLPTYLIQIGNRLDKDEAVNNMVVSILKAGDETDLSPLAFGTRVRCSIGEELFNQLPIFGSTRMSADGKIRNLFDLYSPDDKPAKGNKKAPKKKGRPAMRSRIKDDLVERETVMGRTLVAKLAGLKADTSGDLTDGQKDQNRTNQSATRDRLNKFKRFASRGVDLQQRLSRINETPSLACDFWVTTDKPGDDTYCFQIPDNYFIDTMCGKYLDPEAKKQPIKLYDMVKVKGNPSATNQRSVSVSDILGMDFDKAERLSVDENGNAIPVSVATLMKTIGTKEPDAGGGADDDAKGFHDIDDLEMPTAHLAEYLTGQNFKLTLEALKRNPNTAKVVGRIDGKSADGIKLGMDLYLLYSWGRVVFADEERRARIMDAFIARDKADEDERKQRNAAVA